MTKKSRDRRRAYRKLKSALQEVKLIREGKLPKQSLKEALRGCN